MEVPKWDTEEWEAYAVKYQHAEAPQTYPLPKDAKKMNIGEWLEAMDWFKIRTLHLNRAIPKVLQLLSGPVLPSLKHLRYLGDYTAPGRDQSKRTIAAHENFLNNTIPPLESITFQDIGQLNPDTLIDIIAGRHSPALKHLKLTGTWSKLDERQISSLRASAPNLKTLDIDMSRPPHHDPNSNMEDAPQWDLPLLTALATHPSLKRLTLRFSTPIPDPDEYYTRTSHPRKTDFYGYKGRIDGVEDSLINHASVEEGLWRFLLEHNAYLNE